MEAGKTAAGTVIDTQVRILNLRQAHPKLNFGLNEIAAGTKSPEEIEWMFTMLEHLAGI